MDVFEPYVCFTSLGFLFIVPTGFRISSKSTDRRKNIRGSRRADDDPENPAGGKSFPVHSLVAKPSDGNWMGLQWSIALSFTQTALREVPTLQGVYKIFDSDISSLLYIGETANLRSRLTTHAKKNWQCQQPLFSFVTLPEGTPSYQRHEVENDLLGGYYAQFQTMPRFQLMNHH
ncbi:GIY-YIG nuclease family protein [Ktedonobacter robiniae]|uniref:GIY-YIG nuclease family protein n=1 Tax=Ktedonobacter robiniae TaxID=2778365 RepID=UPI003B75C8E0